MPKVGKLYVVATPIGNLEDITLRALRVLKEVDLILCEDTRVAKKLLGRYDIKKPLVSYHHHSKISKADFVKNELKRGKSLALVSDAGTPGISDPGNELIKHIARNTEHLWKFGLRSGNRISIIPIPGPSALTAIASVAGINMSRFVFLGFAPHKKGREKFFREVAEIKYPVVYHESPYRLLKNLELLAKFRSDANLIIGRELTKIFEEVLRGGVKEVLKYFQDSRTKIKGEFTIVIY